ncbi:MAG: putative membrane protein [Acidimicrobiales bacterium]|jgi:uncharacterized membrane protein
MSELPIRRRARRTIVRFQARLEAGTGDRIVPVVIATALSLFLASLSTARYNSLDTGNDLAGYAQAVWLLGQDLQPEASLFGENIHMLELHWSFVLYPLALLALVVPTVSALVAIQSVAIGLGVFPLWHLARRVANLRVGAATALSLAYALHPSIHELGTNDFHPEALAVPGLIGLAYFGASKRWVWYWVCVVFVLLCRADLGLAVALWGFLHISDGERRAGLWTLGLGTVWSLGLLLVVQPLVSNATVGQYGEYGDSLGEVFLTIATSPLSFLSDLVALQNVALVVALLAPVIFLPLLSLRHLLPALPLGAIYLVTDVSNSGAFAERTALLLAFVFIATAHALNRLGTMGVDRVFIDLRLLATLVAASALLFIGSSPTTFYERPWEWNERTAADVAVLEAVSLLDTNDAVRASPSAIGQLADRPWLYTLDGSQQPQVAFAIFRVRAVLIDERDLPMLPPDERRLQREAFAAGMAQQGFELRYEDTANGVLLFYRP